MADPVIADRLRICTKCSEAKLETNEFFELRTDQGGRFRSQCRVCIATKARQRYSSSDQPTKAKERRSRPDYVEREKQRWNRRKVRPDYRESERLRQAKRAADPVHQDKELHRGRTRRADPIFREKVSKFGKRWYQSNKQRRAELSRKWYELNRAKIKSKRKTEEYRERSRAWLREHLRKNPALKLQRNVTTVISEVLRDGGTPGAFRHLPYIPAQLKRHVERQLLKGMTWENYGAEWHLDHILPVACFTIDHTDPKNCAEFQACWSLSNLRPLWWEENLRKQAKRLHLL